MHFVKYIVLFALVVVSAFASSDWVNFSDPYPIRSAVRFGNGTLMATDGGMRYSSTDGNQIFTSADGLESAAFYSVVRSSKGFVYAVSEFGNVVSLNDDYKRWTILNRSFSSKGVRALPDCIAMGEDVLVIGFENRLAFFDVDAKTYLLTLTRLGKEMLSVNQIQKIAVKDDSLFVALESGVYVRKMDWKNLSGDSRLVDPESWEKLSASSSREELSVLSQPVVVGARDTMIAHWKFPLGEKDTVYVSPYEVFHYDGAKYKRLDSDSTVGEIYELTALPNGGVLAASVDDRISFSLGYEIEFTKKGWFGRGNDDIAYSQRLKVLSATADGYAFYHVWGYGFSLYSDWGQEGLYEFRPGDGFCMDEYLDSYTIATSTVVAPDSTGFLTITGSKSGYSLVYVSFDGEMSCASHIGTTQLAGPMVASMSKDKSEWIVYLGSRTGTSTNASGGLDVLHVTPPSKTGGRLIVSKTSSFSGLSNGTPIDMKLDAKREVLWIVTNSTLGYFELDQDTIRQPKSTKGMQGVSYTSVDVDVQGNVWVGTTNRGAYRLHRYGSSHDSLTATHFTSRDGMLSDDVADIAIDPVLGMAWFAHSKGLSRYKRSDLRDASSFMTDSAQAGVKAYPNPFRPKIHAHVTIDNIAENSTVSIFNRGGSLVQFFEGKDVLGGRVEWDGIGRNGKVVTPGVYYYVVKNSSEIKKGKIIIIR